MGEIDWGLETDSHANETVKLNNTEMNEGHKVTILTMNTTNDGFIVCNVESETLQGNTLWLKGKYGLQNGALSLMRLVSSNDSDDYVGNTYTVTKVESEKSMSGYRYEWTA